MKKSRFNVLYMVFICLTFICYDAKAASHTCESNEYYNKGCTTCQPGCYCTGGTVYDIDWPNGGISDKEVALWCKNGTKCYNAGKCKDGYTDNPQYCYGDCGRSEMAGIHKCPADFPESDAGTDSIENCYKTCKNEKNEGTGKIYNKKVKCGPGEFLMPGTSVCIPCVATENNLDLSGLNQIARQLFLQTESAIQDFYNNARKIFIKDDTICPGMTEETYPSCDESQGIETCKDGTIPNETKTECIAQNQSSSPDHDDESLTCAPGEYVPANKYVCVSCKIKNDEAKDGKTYVCPGDTWDGVFNLDRGAEECAPGTIPNEDYTECVIDSNEIHVNAGYYLPKGEILVKECTDSNTKSTQYCPGGKFVFSNDKNQGIYDCPYDAKHSDNLKGCNLMLTKEQLACGIKGVKSKRDSSISTPQCVGTPCWLSGGADAYIKCVYGSDYVFPGESTDDKQTTKTTANSTKDEYESTYRKQYEDNVDETVVQQTKAR